MVVYSYYRNMNCTGSYETYENPPGKCYQTSSLFFTAGYVSYSCGLIPAGSPTPMPTYGAGYKQATSYVAEKTFYSSNNCQSSAVSDTDAVGLDVCYRFVDHSTKITQEMSVIYSKVPSTVTGMVNYTRREFPYSISCTGSSTFGFHPTSSSCQANSDPDHDNSSLIYTQYTSPPELSGLYAM